MAALLEPARDRYSCGSRVYLKTPEPIHFPSEDSPEEHVGETKRHLEARTTLYVLLSQAFAKSAVGSEQFVYWDAGDPRKCLSPDVFVKLRAPNETFDNWKIWERGAPDLAVEIVSASDRRDLDWEEKLERYQASGINEVVRFDAAQRSTKLRVWDRVDGELLERAPDSDTFCECATLALWWVLVPSELGLLLRLSRDREGKELLPTPSEEAMRLAVELAAERAARTEEHHARLLAEHKLREEAEARARADEARATAERERDDALAELARMRAEIAAARAK